MGIGKTDFKQQLTRTSMQLTINYPSFGDGRAALTLLSKRT